MTRRERRFLGGLTPPWRIQKFLDGLDYDVAGAGCRSPEGSFANGRYSAWKAPSLPPRPCASRDIPRLSWTSRRSTTTITSWRSSARTALGRARALELLGPALSRADPSDDPLARPLLLRVVLQPAPAEDAAPLLAPRQPVAIRRDRLDDLARKTSGRFPNTWPASPTSVSSLHESRSAFRRWTAGCSRPGSSADAPAHSRPLAGITKRRKENAS